MPRDEKVFTVFVASPSDVQDERTRLEEIVRELNLTWSRRLGMRFDLVRWETHAYPAAGADPQAVINEQIPDDYDLFIGIMWCRYGTPTGRAGSGTVEEFQRAKNRFNADSSSVQLLFYFKDAPIKPSTLDPNQLALVKEFRRSLGPKEGILYWTFSDLNDFERLLRMHLARHLQALENKLRPELATPPNVSPALPAGYTLEPNDDAGLLDLFEIYEARFADLSSILGRIGRATTELAEKTEEHNKEIDSIGKSHLPSRSAAKRVFTDAANDMNDFATRVATELDLYKNALDEGVSAFLRTAELSSTLGASLERVAEAKDALAAVRTLRENTSISKGHIFGFRQAVAQLPPFTSAVNAAKRRVVTILDQFVEALRTTQDLFADVDGVLVEAIAKLESQS
jgi:hypothetical protein